MADLPGPMEILELADKQKATLRVRAWSSGILRIFPGDWEIRIQADLRRGAIDEAEAKRRRVDGKEISALRVVVPVEDKPTGPPYWDITSTTLAAQLLPYLESPDFKTKTFVITAFGVAPRKRFTLEVS